MATGKEWGDHFDTLSTGRLQELKAALQILQNDSLFAQEFNWTGIFVLGAWIQESLAEKVK